MNGTSAATTLLNVVIAACASAGDAYRAVQTFGEFGRAGGTFEHVKPNEWTRCALAAEEGGHDGEELPKGVVSAALEEGIELPKASAAPEGGIELPMASASL